nr:LOW QUALITY PROTEIN: serine/arginine repetitive matrix protein 1-like [Cherax quadricarinatus]
MEYLRANWLYIAVSVGGVAVGVSFMFLLYCCLRSKLRHSREDPSATPSPSSHHSLPPCSPTLSGIHRERVPAKPRASRYQSSSSQPAVPTDSFETSSYIKKPVARISNGPPLRRAPTCPQDDAYFYTEPDYPSYILPDKIVCPSSEPFQLFDKSPKPHNNDSQNLKEFPSKTFPKVSSGNHAKFKTLGHYPSNLRPTPEHIVCSFNRRASPSCRLNATSENTPPTITLTSTSSSMSSPPPLPLPRDFPPRSPLRSPLGMPVLPPDPKIDKIEEATVEISMPSDNGIFRFCEAKTPPMGPVTMALKGVDKKFRVKLKLALED